jgi:hypothetical protein
MAQKGAIAGGVDRSPRGRDSHDLNLTPAFCIFSEREIVKG